MLARSALLAVLLALAVPSVALAHANVVQTLPADREALAISPSIVRVVFDDPVQVGPGNEAVSDSGESVLAGRPTVGGTVLELPLRAGLPRGDYSVRWSAISDDGHLEQGVLAFAVGTKAPAAATLDVESGVSTVTVALRWIFLSGLLIAGGLALFALLVWRPVTGRDLPTHGIAVALAAAVPAALALLIRSDAGLSTRFGAAVAAAGALAAVGAAAAFAGIRYRSARALAGAIALGLLVVPTVSGHSLDASRSWLDAPVDLLHVVAVALWLGSLAALALLLPALRVPRDVIGASARRFSRLALVTVGVIAATGVAEAVAALPEVSALWSTGYGQTLLVKSALFTVVVALAWVSRSRLAAGWARLRLSVTAEVLVLLGIVVAVGALTALSPRGVTAVDALALRQADTALVRLPPADATVVAKRDGALAAAVAVRPSGRTFVTFVGQDARAVDIGAVRIDGRPATSCGVGCYAGQAASAREVRVEHGDTVLRFDLGARRPVPRDLLPRMRAAYAGLTSTIYKQWTETGSGRAFAVTWREGTPHRFSYRIDGGAEAIVVGQRRWDRAPGQEWEATSTARTPEFVPPWGNSGRLANAQILREGRRTLTVGFLGASRIYPAWFEVTVARRDLRILNLRMTAAAHFMVSRYLAWNEPVEIRPPADAPPVS
jgi:copper transport protein